MALQNALDRHPDLTTLPDGEYCDGGGLYLRVSGLGGRSWLSKFQWSKKQEKMGIGPLTRVSLAEAREKNAAIQKQVRERIYPKLHREEDAQPRSAPLFKDFATEFCTAWEENLKGEKSRQKLWRCINVYMAPLHKLPINKIGIDEVLKVLQPMWKTKPTAARETRQRLEKILGAAKAKRHIPQNEANPAIFVNNLEHWLPKKQGNAGKRGKHKSIPFKDMPDFMVELRDLTAQSARMLEVCILTCTRTSEIIQMEWDQIDWAKGRWVIPGKAMKNDLEADIPLTDTVLAILREIKKAGLDKRLVFPGLIRDDKGRALPCSTNTMLKLVKVDMDRKATVHGFRSSFRSWGQNRQKHSREVLEYCLHHIEGGEAELAYARDDIWDARKAALTDWETFCNSKKGPRLHLVA